jgi:6-pyruvoyltetrahydropterin/6-carboxytetrahydropterin synthase
MSELQSIAVSHHFEAAHRLFLTPGKCENIHGHSFQCGVEIYGSVDKRGMVCSLDFGTVKQVFRNHLDSFYDHRLLLNEEDDWAQVVHLEEPEKLPGLQALPSDPTTENLARWIGAFMLDQFKDAGITGLDVALQETRVNAATWSWNA